MTDKLMSCCSPQLAGINQPLGPSMFGPTESGSGGPKATTTTGQATAGTFTTTTKTTNKEPTTALGPERAEA